MVCFGLGLGFGCDHKPKPRISACKPKCWLGKPLAPAKKAKWLVLILRGALPLRAKFMAHRHPLSISLLGLWFFPVVVPTDSMILSWRHNNVELRYQLSWNLRLVEVNELPWYSSIHIPTELG
jgi:hypothetical protein